MHWLYIGVGITIDSCNFIFNLSICFENDYCTMNLIRRGHLAIMFFGSMLALACKHPAGERPINTVDFPAEVGAIIIGKCAVSGCHNASSYTNAANLRLDSWDALFKGSSSGAVVVPYSAAYSSLLYYTNTDSTLGTVVQPTMPLSSSVRPLSALTRAEYLVLKQWIEHGAPNADGQVAFSTNVASRQKIYITQQGCDQVAVVDGATHLVMRYIPVGMSAAAIESPHSLKVATNGDFAFVSYTNGTYAQKIDTKVDTVVGSARLTDVKFGGSWNVLYPTPDGKHVLVTDFSGDGLLAWVTANTMLLDTRKTVNTLIAPHGVTSNSLGDTFWVTQQYGNSLVKFSFNGPFKKTISLDGQTAYAGVSSSGMGQDPHELVMTPDYNKYIVSCQNSNEIRIMDAHWDTLIKAVAVGRFPQEMDVSKINPYVYVSCMNDDNNRPGMKGSVYVVNYNTGVIVGKIQGDFYEPHGLAVDDMHNKLYVVSSNRDPSGPSPHHATACFGRAGWYSVYNATTLQPWDNNRYQLAVQPYSAGVRFK